MSFKKIIHEIVPVHDGELYVERVGCGTQPLILIHAGFSDRRDWTHQFNEFGKKYLTVAYDQRGAGNSSTIATAFSPANDLKALTENLKSEKSILIGHSLGGAIALDFALQYPEKVSALVLIASGLNGYAWSNKYSELMGKIWKTLEPEAMTNSFLAADFFEIAMSLPNIKTEICKMTSANFAKVLTWKTFNSEDVLWYFPDPLTQLKNLDMPVLVVYGDKDSDDIKQIADIFNKNIKNVKTYVIKNADHLLNYEKPDELNNLVLDFLEEVDRKTSFDISSLQKTFER